MLPIRAFVPKPSQSVALKIAIYSYIKRTRDDAFDLVDLSELLADTRDMRKPEVGHLSAKTCDTINNRGNNNERTASFIRWSIARWQW